jgi:5-deoxy-D-glucuronate isomerase
MDAARLAQVPLFADLTDDERAEVAACMREVAVDPGTTLATEGDNAYELFVIEAGDADVQKGGEVIRKLGPGDVFGEIGLLATGTRTATVVATSPMRLARCSRASTSGSKTRCPGSRSRCARRWRSASPRPPSERPTLAMSDPNPCARARRDGD